MTGPTRTRASKALLACALGLALSLTATTVPAAAEVHFSKEEQPAYEHQLKSRQIVSAIINKRIRRVHLTTKDGGHFSYTYAPHEEPKVKAALEAKGAAVTVLSPAAAKKEATVKSGFKHKVKKALEQGWPEAIVVIVIVGGILLVRRRRTALAE